MIEAHFWPFWKHYKKYGVSEPGVGPQSRQDFASPHEGLLGILQNWVIGGVLLVLFWWKHCFHSGFRRTDWKREKKVKWCHLHVCPVEVLGTSASRTLFGGFSGKWPEAVHVYGFRHLGGNDTIANPTTTKQQQQHDNNNNMITTSTRTTEQQHNNNTTITQQHNNNR